MTRILVVDNYDSFVYNLVQYLGQLGADPMVVRNDAVDVAGALALEPDGILVSPGPGRPEGAGISTDLIRAAAGEGVAAASAPARAAGAAGPAGEGGVPVLGVCLGHQCIGAAFGATVVRHQVMHGKTSEISHDGRGVFAGLPDPLTATRYHSLVIDPASLPAELEASAWAPDGTLMGIRHRHAAAEGVQFHPESILTVAGHRLLANWLAVCGHPDALAAVPA